MNPQDEFDALKPKSNEYLWATYIPSRSNKRFKVHRTLGYAKAAITSSRGRWNGLNRGFELDQDGEQWIDRTEEWKIVADEKKTKRKANSDAVIAARRARCSNPCEHCSLQ